MQVGATPPLIGAQQPAGGLRHGVQRRGLAGHHVLVELGRPPHGLAGIVDDEVEPVPGCQQLPAERLDARRMAQVEPEDLEPVPPVGKIRFRGVADRGVPGEAGGDDQVGAGAQQLDAGLVADLDPAAGQQRHPAPQVGQLGALGEVERRAGRAHLVVEVVDGGVLLLADVAVLRLDRLPELGVVDLPLLERGPAERRWGWCTPPAGEGSGCRCWLSTRFSCSTFSALRRRTLARTSWRRAAASGA